jgi:Flp pilus assembly protein CpaB
MAKSLMDKVTTTRGGAIAVGVAVAVVAAILLLVYVTQYKSSVDSTAAAVPVLQAKSVIPKGTPGATVATKQLYVSTSVPADKAQPNAIGDPAALAGRTAVSTIYPGTQLTLDNFTAVASGAVNAQIVGPQRGVSMTIDPLHGSLANIVAGDHVDVYTEVTRDGRLVIQLFRSDITVLQAPGAAGGTVVLEVNARDAADMLFAAMHTTLYFVIRPVSGGTPTPKSLADLSTVVASSRVR